MQRSNTHRRTSNKYQVYEAAGQAVLHAHYWNACIPPFRRATPLGYQVNPIPNGNVVYMPSIAVSSVPRAESGVSKKKISSRFGTGICWAPVSGLALAYSPAFFESPAPPGLCLEFSRKKGTEIARLAKGATPNIAFSGGYSVKKA